MFIQKDMNQLLEKIPQEDLHSSGQLLAVKLGRSELDRAIQAYLKNGGKVRC